MLGIQTWGGRTEGTDESTELRRHPIFYYYFVSFCERKLLAERSSLITSLLDSFLLAEAFKHKKTSFRRADGCPDQDRQAKI